MNLATLERMIAEGDLSRDAFQYLLNCRCECEWLDYKEMLHIENDEQLCDFSKDVLAFKNVGGGYIVVGVRDKTWQQVGLEEPLAYDSKLLRDKVMSATGVSLDINIVTHSIRQESGERHYAVILVRGGKKRRRHRRPSVVGKDFCSGRRGIRRGEIYVRNLDSTERVASQQEMDELLDRLEYLADEAAIQLDVSPSIFAIEDGTYKLLEKGYERFVGRIELRQKLIDAICGDPRIWIINVHGPGGVGKSALVNWVTYKLYEERRFEAILQLTAKETALTDKGISGCSRSLYSLENLLDQILILFQENPDIELKEKKVLVTELLSAWYTLLILDNMETVSDGRILAFIQSLPPESKARILLTSRTKTGGWELPIPVTEMTLAETTEFLKLKSDELQAGFPLDPRTALRVTNTSGGLPLAAQWIVGQYKRSRNLDSVLSSAGSMDSPILEFSFRNIWNTLSPEAKTILAILSIFDGPPSLQQLAIATEMPYERIENALSELIDVTLVNRTLQQEDGQFLFSALPITLSFARNELSGMGDFEIRSRQRLQRYNEQMELQKSEVDRFSGEFTRYGIDTPNEKRAVILCRQAESAMFGGNPENADILFRQARDLAPHSAYVLARIASYELTQNRVGLALERVNEACQKSNKKTGALCYSVKARIFDVQRNRLGRVDALGKAVEYDPKDTILRHQYGVALSLAGHEHDAIEQFTQIIKDEERRVPVRDTLVMALVTRIINYKRLYMNTEADADMVRARKVIEENPRLSYMATKLDGLE